MTKGEAHLLREGLIDAYDRAVLSETRESIRKRLIGMDWDEEYPVYNTEEIIRAASERFQHWIDSAPPEYWEYTQPIKYARR